MAEQTYQEYKQARTEPPAEPVPEAPAETPTPDEVVTPEPEAVIQDSPPDEDGLEDESVEETVPREKRRERTERRFKRLNDRARRIERENDELKGQITALTQMLQPGEPQPPASEPGQPDDGRPSRDDFPDDDDYFEAVADWKNADLKAEIKGLREEAARTNVQAETDQVQSAYAERLEAARDRYPDYDEVVDASDTTMDRQVLVEIVKIDAGPDVVYCLAKNPEEAEKLNGLSPVGLGRALAKIEANLASSVTEVPTPPTEPPNQPPAPINPLGGGGTASQAPREPDQLSYKDYKAARLKGRIR